MRLMNKGAVIMGTESPELLLEEYELAKKNACCRRKLEIDEN